MEVVHFTEISLIFPFYAPAYVLINLHWYKSLMKSQRLDAKGRLFELVSYIWIYDDMILCCRAAVTIRQVVVNQEQENDMQGPIHYANQSIFN